MSASRHHSTRRKGLVLLFTGLVAIAILGVATTASAQSAAVLGLGGDGSERLNNELGEILLNAVEVNPGLEVYDQRDLNVSEALMFLGCSEVTNQCLRELAFTLEVDRVLYAAVREAPDDTEVDVRYFDAINNENLLDQTFPINDPADRTELEMRLAAVVSNQVVLRVNADRPDVSIFLDGELLGQAPTIVMDLEPGRHILTAECDDCPEYERVLELRRGVDYTEMVRVGGDAVADVGDDQDDDDDFVGDDDTGGGRNVLVPAITIAAGGAMLITGTIFGVMMNSTQDDFDTTPSLPEAESLADDGETQALLANIFLAGGAAVTITGIILLFTMDGDEERPPTEVRAAPFVGQSSGGFMLEGAF